MQIELPENGEVGLRNTRVTSKDHSSSSVSSEVWHKGPEETLKDLALEFQRGKLRKC